MTYKALGRSIANYAVPVWSINASETNIGKIQCAQNEALRIITGSHKMPSITHLHSETKMLLVKDHPNLLSAQYLVHCLDTENVCHHITMMDHPLRDSDSEYILNGTINDIPGSGRSLTTYPGHPTEGNEGDTFH